MIHGIRGNCRQILQHMLQVLLVGMTLGMMRTVVPALAEKEFGVPRDSFVLLTTFVVAFGLVKGLMNFAAGRLAEKFGRRAVLISGWLVALPIPAMIAFATSWRWIVAATVLLGVNQGLTWSMTQTAKLDLTRADQRGLVIGLNEFAGYLGLALAGIVTGYIAARFGARQGLMWFGYSVIGLALFLAWQAIIETRPWALTQAQHSLLGLANQNSASSDFSFVGSSPTTWELFALMSWRDRRLAAICQAGLIEKFVDALVWVFWPIYLYQRGISLQGIGWIVGVYGVVWGCAQLITGRLSDRIGRQFFNVAGMWLCGLGVALFPHGSSATWWSCAAALTGLGMAMLYPNLSAAVTDIASAQWRASAIGIYRFWRDLGYGIGALALGVIAASGGGIEPAFWFVAGAMFLSGLILLLFAPPSAQRRGY